MDKTAQIKQIITNLKANGFTVESRDDNTFSVESDDGAGLNALVVIGETQIQVSSVLFKAADVNNPAALNDLILRTQQMIPLTNVGLMSLNGADYYTAYGSLSINSPVDQVIEEIETLFNNIPELLDAYSDLLN